MVSYTLQHISGMNIWSPGILFIELAFLQTMLVQGENVTVYPGYVNHLDYTLYNSPLTWLEANHACESKGGVMMDHLWRGFFDYLESTASQNNWTLPSYVWVGFYKGRNDNLWYSPLECDVPLILSVNNHSYDEQQCMRVDPLLPDILWAVSCETEAAYMCEVYTGNIYNSSAGYFTYEFMDVERRNHKSTEQPVSFDACIFLLFYQCFNCYAAFYNSTWTTCEIYKVNNKNLPLVVSVTPTNINETLILKNGSRVYFVNTTDNTGYSHGNSYYPCHVSSSSTSVTTTSATTTSATTTSAPTTSASTTSVIPTSVVTTSVTTDVTIATTGLCECYCYTSNKTYEMILKEIMDRENDLSVDKDSLSSCFRQKHSAPDDRMSSSAMGYAAIVVLTLVTLFICGKDFCEVICAINYICRGKKSAVREINTA